MEYLLKRIAILNDVGVECYDEHDNLIQCFEEHPERSPMFQSKELRQLLMEGAASQEIPYLYKDSYMVYFAAVKKDKEYYMIGPMSLQLLERMDLHQYYSTYGMDYTNARRLTHFNLAQMLDIVEMIANILLHKEYTDDDLIYANQLVNGTKQQEEHEQVLYDMKEGEEELYHHTYQEERKLLDSIRDGRIEDALRYSRNMDADLGKLSGKELNHWKNVAIVAITLCTRAAIDGGISPSIAYRISDFYIQKSDGCKDIAQVIKYRDHAVEELTTQVVKKQTRRSSSYVERCKDYIDQNYKNKIYLSDMAESLGISETYLSRLFKKETGIRLQDFIIDVRLEHAANLLKFSEESISNIAEYVHFPSQSYMGKAFKAKYDVTPKQYREKNRPTEFYTNQAGYTHDGKV